MAKISKEFNTNTTYVKYLYKNNSAISKKIGELITQKKPQRKLQQDGLRNVIFTKPSLILLPILEKTQSGTHHTVGWKPFSFKLLCTRIQISENITHRYGSTNHKDNTAGSMVSHYIVWHL